MDVVFVASEAVPFAKTGGLADVEWTVQLLQLCHAAEVPGLQVTSTLPALAAAESAGLIGAEDAAVLRTAWLQATRVRGAMMIEKVFRMRKVPTNSATPANPSSTLLKKPSPVLMFWLAEALSSALVCTW